MIDEREPPHNIAAERALIGAALVHGNDGVCGLRPDDFFMPEHREAWTAVLAVVARKVPPDLVMVGAEIKAAGMEPRFEGGWGTWAVGVAAEASILQMVDHYARLVRDAATKRKLISLCAEVKSAAYGGRPLEELLSTWRSEGAKLETYGTDSKTVHVRVAVSEVLDDIERIKSGKKEPVVTTCLNVVDDIIGGGRPGQLIIVAARPSVGKSAWGGNIAVGNALRGIPAFYGSAEMMRNELACRFLSQVAKVDGNKILRGDVDLEEGKAVFRAGMELDSSLLWVNDGCLEFESTCREIRRWHAENVRGRLLPDGTPDKRAAVIADYLQRYRIAYRKGESREQEVTRIASGFKSLAMELQIPIFAMCQLSRAVELRGGDPVLSDLRESGAIEQEANIVIFIVRDMEDLQNRNKRGKARMIVGKNRGGRIGVAESEYIPEYTEFVNAMGAGDNAGYDGPDTRGELREDGPPRSFHDRDE